MQIGCVRYGAYLENEKTVWNELADTISCFFIQEIISFIRTLSTNSVASKRASATASYPTIDTEPLLPRAARRYLWDFIAALGKVDLGEMFCHWLWARGSLVIAKVLSYWIECTEGFVRGL